MKIRSTWALLLLFGVLVLQSCSPQSTVAEPSPTQLSSTATTIPTPSPTPEKYPAEAVAYVPHSVEEIPNSVEVRSPIDDPAGYKEDMAQILKVIHEQILPNYSGDMLRAGGHQFYFDSGGNLIGFQNMELNPIGSMSFKWESSKGELINVPVLFFPGEDAEGRFVYSMILDPAMDHINKRGRPDNPAPDWHMSELIKKFPMKISGGGVFESFYYVYTGPGGHDEFATAYFEACSQMLGVSDPSFDSAYWELLGPGGVFDKKFELVSMVSKGGG